MLRRILLTALAFSLSIQTARASVAPDVSNLTSSLHAVQLPDGAFADSAASKETHVTPYRGAYAAIGLALAGDPQSALAFARWYVAHMNSDDEWGPGCTIYDFTFTRRPFRLESTKTGNAMDAPAGVFLTALRSLYATGDARAQAWVTSQQSNAECIARAASGLYHSEYHCTQAIVGYDFCLTEDNFEVWRGLGDIAWLERNVWGSPSLSSTYRHEQSDIGAGLQQMWDAGNQNYNWARSTSTGAFTKSAWSQFYPGSVTQLWPVVVGFAQPDDPRSVALWRTFKTAWPSMTVQSPVNSPWPWTATAAAAMGDLSFVGAYAGCLGAEYVASGYPYPWESNDSGNMLTALILAGRPKPSHRLREGRRRFRYACFLQRGARGLTATP